MKTKNIIIIFVCIMLTAFVLGTTGIIQLVNVSAKEADSPDKLIGVLITREYLDLFDSGQFLADNASRLAGGGEISELESARYRGKLYASLVETGLIDEERGEASDEKEYVFEGVNGICYFAPRMTEQFGTYWSSSSDEAVTDGHIHFMSTDEGDSIAMEGTIYVSAGAGAGSFYFNPVYQTPAGEVYAVTGNGMSVADDESSVAGMSMSYEIKENHSSAVGDVTTASGSEIKITISYMEEPVKVSILQFDSENTLLSQIDYSPDSLPGNLKTQPDTQYIIVETTALSREGTVNVTRDIYQSEDDNLSAFYCRGDGICVKQWCEIDWSR